MKRLLPYLAAGLFLSGLSCCLLSSPATSPVLSMPVAILATDVGANVMNAAAGTARLGRVAAEDVPGDPLLSIAKDSVDGNLVYVFSVYKSSKLTNYLTIRRLRTKTADEDAAIATYSIENIDNNYVFDPQFSPDGNQVLFKIGHYGSEHPYYRLWLLNINTARLKPVSQRELHYPLTRWSPDGSYTAYIAGGDYQGNFDERRNEPMELIVCNVKTGREHLIAHGDSVMAGFSWGYPHTLFYSAQSASPKARDKNSKSVTDNTLPNIYEVTNDLETSEVDSKLLIEDAWHPVVSPEGQKIAFLGSGNTDKSFSQSHNWPRNAKGVALSVVQRDDMGRFVLNRELSSYPALFWTTDSRHLLTLQQTAVSPNAKGQVKIWNIADRTWRQIATFHAKDYAVVQRADVESQFGGKRIENGKLFVVSDSVTGEDEKNDTYKTEAVLNSMDIDTGVITQIARIKNGVGLDWYSTKTNESRL